MHRHAVLHAQAFYFLLERLPKGHKARVTHTHDFSESTDEKSGFKSFLDDKQHTAITQQEGAEVMLQFYPRLATRLALLGLLHPFLGEQRFQRIIDNPHILFSR